MTEPKSQQQQQLEGQVPLKAASESPQRDSRSQDVLPPDPTLKVLGWMASDSVLSLSEFHMTVKFRISEPTPKQASLLLSIANTRACFNGVDITLYLAMEFLFSWLRRGNYDPLYEKNEKVRQTLMVTELLLSSVRGEWLTLGTKERIPDEVVERIDLLGWLPSERTLQSWKQHWKLEQYLRIKIVPVEHILERQPNSSERYSAYTRGYGQDGNPPAPHKPRLEPLDVAMEELAPPAIPLQELENYQHVLQLIEAKKAAKRRG